MLLKQQKTNPYEYIHTNVPNSKSSICKLNPLSRSFYKMIELINTLNLFDNNSETIKSFHLAEGPGGFIEALSYIRKNPNDTYYGMTLMAVSYTHLTLPTKRIV